MNAHKKGFHERECWRCFTVCLFLEQRLQLLFPLVPFSNTAVFTRQKHHEISVIQFIARFMDEWVQLQSTSAIKCGQLY